MSNALEEDSSHQRLEQLEREIAAIKERNHRVEADKAWELSQCRVICIVVATFVMTAIVFWLIAVEQYLLNALIATACYYISTQSLPFAKRWWIARWRNNNQ